MKIVYRAKDIVEAHLIVGLLQSNDIEAFVDGHYLQGAIGEIGMSDFALVRVNDADYQQALQVVQQYDASAGNELSGTEKNSGFKTEISYVLALFLVAVFLLALFFA